MTIERRHSHIFWPRRLDRRLTMDVTRTEASLRRGENCRVSQQSHHRGNSRINKIPIGMVMKQAKRLRQSISTKPSDASASKGGL